MRCRPDSTETDGGDHGFSLPEILISLTILSVVLAVFFAALFNVQAGVARSSDRSLSNDEARLALRQIDREIRSGNVFYDPALDSAGAGMGLLVWTQANATTRPLGHRCIQWKLDGTKLVSRSWATNWRSTSPPDVAAWRTIADNIVNRARGVRLFELDTSPTYGGRLMKLRILANASTNADRAVELRADVNGRNTRYGQTPTPCNDIPPS